MQPARSLALYLVWVFGGAPLIAPVAYWSIQGAAIEFPMLAGFASEPFHRYLNRSLLGMALVGIWPLMRGFRQGTWDALGLVGGAERWGQWGKGFALGLGSLAAAGLVVIAGGGRELNLEAAAPKWVSRCASAFLSAGVVSVMEEVLFRGAIFGAFVRFYSLGTGLTVSSTIYALVHFMGRPESPPEVEWWSGFSTLAAMFGGMVEPWRLIPGLLNLLVVGVMLGLAYYRTGSLYFPMGLHAGWILWGKIYGFGTREVVGGDAMFWGSGKVFDGWLALIVLACVAPLLHHLTQSEVRRDWAQARAVHRDPMESVE